MRRMERFLPGRHQIESFGNGGFRLGGMSHQGSIIITPSGVRACEALSASTLEIDHLESIVAEKDNIDMLLVGTGLTMAPLPISIAQHLAKSGIPYDTMSTNAAVRIYNVVEAENRRVAAILIAVDNAHG
jgi:uncharacterized protein